MSNVSEDIATGIQSLPPDLVDLILARLPCSEVFKVQPVCKSWSECRRRASFRQERARLGFLIECSLSPLVFNSKEDGSWHFWGYDFLAGIWRTVAPFRKPIPGPDPELFKDFHVTAHQGLFCVNVGKASESEELYVYNPLMGETHRLPPLEYSRQPVVIHVHVTLAKRKEFVASRYWVIVIGSAAIGSESLSRKTEVYDSETDAWEVVDDVPGEDFCINDYQTGVLCEKFNLLLCVGFMVDGRKGILAFDVEKRKWVENFVCPFFQLHPENAQDALTVYFAIAHLVKCGETVYLFSEQEVGRVVTHCLDRLDLDNRGGHAWTRVKTIPRHGNRALLVYPEFTCVPVGENKLCIFNTIEKTGVVYDMLTNHAPTETLPPPPSETGMVFHSLNPIGYSFEPSFVPLPLPKFEMEEKKDEMKIDDEKKDEEKQDEKKKDDVENLDDLQKEMSKAKIS